jgi:hypothetical protein
MARNYSDGATYLHQLVHDASREAGATLLIPDLQRPFVWSPTQVVLLVDSLLRGWPFGTLLLWSVRNEELGVIPHRPFWKIVDRTSDTATERVSQALAPQEFRMVLDGQQRLQSLLLAFGGDEWGFKLTDKDWYEDIEQQRWRGRNSDRHWSRAQLYLDLKAFDAKVAAAGDTRKIEYRDVLVWAIGRQDGGQSAAPKPINYNEPLSRVYDTANAGRFVRLSRLWALAKPNTPEREYRDWLRKLLSDHSVSSGLMERTVSPLAEVMITLNEAKEARVAYLELAARRESDDPDIYNDAIVNIFTRLNAAGRVLTRQEITFAWIKQGWEAARTAGRGAAECFELLREKMALQKFEIDLDELVRFVSAVWSTVYNGGRLLGPNDLLRGDKIRPLARNLVDGWEGLESDLVEFCSILEEEELRLGDVYVSLNAAIILGALWSLLRRWGRLHKLNVTEKDSYEKQCDALLRSRADRWLLCSQWADLWGSSNDQSFAQHISDLSKTWEAIEKAGNPPATLNIAASLVDEWIRKLIPDASGYIQTLEVDQRQFVKAYYAPIWIWLRLDRVRWEMATIPLRTNGRQNPFWHVDHIVPVKIWEAFGLGPASENDTSGRLILPVHAIGNCLLLESSFNISKGKDELDAFLKKVHEFRSGEVPLGDWCKELAIADELRQPMRFSSTLLADAVDLRTKAIKDELIEYVEGRRDRNDSAPRLERRKQGQIAPAERTTFVFHDLSDLIAQTPPLPPICDQSLQAIMPWQD